jgi:alkylated DNA nucleotide flippase Atl1
MWASMVGGQKRLANCRMASMARKKTYREKLADHKDFPRVVEISPGMAKTWGQGTIVIPRAAEVDAIMRKVPKGKLITINQIREIVAARHGATIGCPIVVGIQARIAAGAAAEDQAEGKKRITPYWRTLKTGGEVNPKYPDGVEGQASLLKHEGHKLRTKGKRMMVENFEASLVHTSRLI